MTGLDWRVVVGLSAVLLLYSAFGTLHNIEETERMMLELDLCSELLRIEEER